MGKQDDQKEVMLRGRPLWGIQGAGMRRMDTRAGLPIRVELGDLQVKSRMGKTAPEGALSTAWKERVRGPSLPILGTRGEGTRERRDIRESERSKRLRYTV